MTSHYATRSRSRTTPRPPARGSGRSSRSSTRPSWTDYEDSIPHHAAEAFRTWDPRQVNWRSPDRHVLIIVNFRELADMTSQPLQLPPNADFLDAACRVFLDALGENSLFTWCRHFNFNYRATIETTIGNVCDLISGRIRETWDIHIPGTDLELRGYDLWGETVQFAKDNTIATALDSPFTLHLSCHRIVPSVILP